MVTKRHYIRHFLAYKDYFKDFKRTLTKSVIEKIYSVFMLIMTTEEIPSTFFRSIKGVNGLFEIRIEEQGNIYRIFCCFDEGELVILFNGFHKKTQKTPQDQIKKAERIMKEYFEEKQIKPWTRKK